jgi:hypothetical protein
VDIPQEAFLAVLKKNNINKMSEIYPKQGEEELNPKIREAEEDRYARIGNLWWALTGRSKTPVNKALFYKAWKILREKGLDSRAQQLLHFAQAGTNPNLFTEEGYLENRKRMAALMKFYRLLEDNLVLEALSPELTRAGYKKLDKR